MNFLALNQYRTDWFGNIRNDLMAGLVVALALIPESIAFSIMAGVDPKVGLYSSFLIAVTIAFFGGRTGMISAATGAMAIAMVLLVKNHGIEYMLAATILCGFIQIIAGFMKWGAWMRFISRPVFLGIVNALSLFVFMAQVVEFKDASYLMYGMVALGIAIIYLFPKLTKAIPSPLIAVIVLSAISMYFNLDLRTVGDKGEFPEVMPFFMWPTVPLTWETLWIVLPYSLTLAAVGILESLLTAKIIDDLTDTKTNRDQECKGQGIANIVAGLFGGMGGCAMIGQSVINIKSGGRGRLSTCFAGAAMMAMILLGAEWVREIPMAALVSVMIMVAIGTFSWSSIRDFRKYSFSHNIVMITTVVVTMMTHDLSKGVLVGVLLSALFFAKRVSRFMYVDSVLSEDGGVRTYFVKGQIFFASTERFINSFNTREVVPAVIIDVSQAHFWDVTAVAAIDEVVLKYRRQGTLVEVVGLNEGSALVIERWGIQNKPNALELMNKH
jgi:SulP family sulfate permease